MKHKYGEFSKKQIAEMKERIRKRIFFLLVLADPEKNEEHKNVDICVSFRSVMTFLGGLNSLLHYPVEIVTILSLLEAALIELKQNEFNILDFRHSTYRKLILDAVNEVSSIKEV